MERISEIEEKLKESVCSAQLPAEQKEIIQRVKGDQLINTEEIKKNKELINKVRIELETKQENLLSSSDEFHEKKLENIKSDFQKEITTTKNNQIKEAINEAFQGKKMVDLVNDCVLNLNNKESIQETKYKPVDATQFEVLNDRTGNLSCIDVSEDVCEENCEITEKMIKPIAASSKRQWEYESDEEEDNLILISLGSIRGR